MKSIIRAATQADLEALECIEGNAWDSLSTPMPVAKYPAFGKALRIEDTLVAQLAEKVVGYITVGQRTPAQSNIHVDRIHSIAILPEARRLGLGNALVQAALEEARRRHWKKLTLTVLSSNYRALGLYLKHGFSEEARLAQEFLVDGQFIDDVFMSYWLDRS